MMSSLRRYCLPRRDPLLEAEDSVVHGLGLCLEVLHLRMTPVFVRVPVEDLLLEEVPVVPVVPVADLRG